MLQCVGLLCLVMGLAVSASVNDANDVLKDVGGETGKCHRLPATYTAGFTDTSTVIIGGKSYDSISYGVTYSDNTKGRKIMMNMTSTDLTTGKGQLVYYYQLGENQYTANPATKTCYKMPMLGPIMLTEMPNGAKYLGLRRYGGKRDGMLAEAWYVHYQDTNVTVDLSITLSHKSCTPNTVAGRVAQPSGPLQYQMEYYDMEMEVKDPSVFTLPDYCKKTSQGA